MVADFQSQHGLLIALACHILLGDPLLQRPYVIFESSYLTMVRFCGRALNENEQED
jgi:hypothetical protein